MINPNDTAGAGETQLPFSMMKLIEYSIVLLLVVGLLLGVLTVLWPFTTAILFGTTLTIAAWPLRQALVRWGLDTNWQQCCWLMLSLVVIVLPVLVMAPILMDQLTQGHAGRPGLFRGRHRRSRHGWPMYLLVGSRLGRIWDELHRVGGDLGAAFAPFATTIRQMLLAAAGALTDSVIALILSLIVATMFWTGGDTLAA